VISVQPNGAKSAALRLYIASDHVAGNGPGGMPNLPLSGSPAGFAEQEIEPGKSRWTVVIDNVGKPDGPSLVTALVVNRSYVLDLPGFTIRRELLMPAGVRSGRANGTGCQRSLADHLASYSA